MPTPQYALHLKGYVGGWDFDADVVDYCLERHATEPVHILIDSLGGQLSTALSIASAFARHGQVHVHYTGMNASAATIASLGAQRVTIDASAMYLVHKCSMDFFKWATANADRLADIIEEAQQMKTDLEKMDANVAQMYARRCRRKTEDLLALMRQGGWLTAEEAHEWGFVDEVTHFDDDPQPVIDARVCAAMGAAGIPLPRSIHTDETTPVAFLQRLVETFTRLFRTPSKPNDMQTTTTPQQPDITVENAPCEGTPTAPTPEGAPITPAEPDLLAARDAEIAVLRAELDALRRAPGDATSQVVDAAKRPAAEPDPDTPEAFIQTRNRATSLYNELP